MAEDSNNAPAVKRPPGVKRSGRPSKRSQRAHIDPKTGLMPQEEVFAVKVAAGEMLIDALIAADPSKLQTATRKSIARLSSDWAKRPAIQARIKALREGQRQHSKYTLQRVMEETDDAIALAKAEANPSAFVAAIALRAKINGLMVEDRKNDRRPYEELSEAELDGEIRRALDDIERAESLH